MRNPSRAVLALFFSAALPVAAAEVTVTIENLAPSGGTYLTPFWVGAHDGTFDAYDEGEAASPALERLAEDGNASELRADFDALGAGTDGMAFGPEGPIAPGEIARVTLELDPMDPAHRFLGYAAMVIPSNDAFVGNDDPTAVEIFDVRGAFVGGSWILRGDGVLDAGTEVNDEVPANTAFFGQASPDTGVPEGGVVGMHEGFLPPGSGGILDDAMFAAADFREFGYRIARVTVSIATPLTVSITNLGPENGSYLTPAWIGTHDGGFDLLDEGAPASEDLERLAEDGATGPLAEAFTDADAGAFQTTVPGPDGPLAPGQTAQITFSLDGSLPGTRYLSFASMVIPSNDAFVANDDPHAFPLFDARGGLRLGEFVLAGTEVYDAGTEMNDEQAETTAFFGQDAPDTGTAEGGVVRAHPGLLPSGSGGIVDDPMFANADFSTGGGDVVAIRVTAAGLPAVRLNDGDRFRVSAVWEDAEGGTGTARGIRLARDTAALYFFSQDNLELTVKVLDACGISDRYWVFASGLTDVGVELLVEDLESGQIWTASTAVGEVFEPRLDTSAFATCP